MSHHVYVLLRHESIMLPYRVSLIREDMSLRLESSMPGKEPLQLVIGDVVELRKPHPCGSRIWTITGLGADIRMRCDGCGRRVLLPRRTLEKRLKRFQQRGPAFDLADEILSGSNQTSERSPADGEDDVRSS